MLSEISQKEKTELPHSHVKSQKVAYIEAESRNVVTRSREVEEMGKCWSKDTKLQLCRINKSRDLMYSMMTAVNNTVLNTGNLLRE